MRVAREGALAGSLPSSIGMFASLLLHARPCSVLRARHATLCTTATPYSDEYHVPVLCAEAVDWSMRMSRGPSFAYEKPRAPSSS